MEQPAVLVTGANGMVGRALCSALRARGSRVRAALRQAYRFPGSGGAILDSVVIGEIGPETSWRAALQGVGCVVHLAARVHVMRETAADPLAEYRRVNTSGTERLARMAAEAAVKRFVFVSTVKVNGEKSPPTSLSQGGSRPFSEADSPNPQDAYGISKWEAEQALARVASGTGLEVVILRPPLVYGPGVKGNFLSLLNALYRAVPLPLGSVKNRRSLIYLGNLVDAIALCVSHPQAAGQTFLVSDGEDLSTSELIRRVADALGRPARLLPLPPALLKLAGSVTGKSGGVARLTESLRVDNSKIRAELKWSPPYSMEEGLRETAAWFRATVR
jgi:nucleoside-diphosphate-sugar epimerase